MLGVKIANSGSVSEVENERIKKNHNPLVRNMKGFIGFRLNRNFEPLFIDEEIEEITGYDREDFLSGRVEWAEIILPADMPSVRENIKKLASKDERSVEIEYRIRRKDGEIRWVTQILQKLPEDSELTGDLQGITRDITERRAAEETLKKIDEMRIKEIHHRIKNNLQVISSLLSLEAEKFSDKKILEAFRESQNRVTSMAIIHEELYKGNEIDTLDFAAYLRKLTVDLLDSYSVQKENIELKMDLEEIYLDMDTAIPLGIIVNELVSNSLKHAFPEAVRGEIHISLGRTDNFTLSEGSSGIKECKNRKNLKFRLAVADNGKGIPEGIDLQNTESLGFQLVDILVDQIDGCMELKRREGTEFTILFGDSGK